MKFLLYKFFEKEEYRQAFLDGILYSNKLSYYRTQENRTAGVKDDCENANLIAWSDHTHFVQNRIIQEGNSVFVQSIAYDTKPSDYIEHQGFIAFNEEDFRVFCMSTIILDDIGIVTHFDKRNKDCFGDFGVLLSNSNVFIQRVCQSITRNKSVSCLRRGFVNYIDYEKRDSIQSWTPFCKFSEFSFQQEYRFVFSSESEGALQYDIEPINDIALNIYDKDAFYASVNVGDKIPLRGEM